MIYFIQAAESKRVKIGRVEYWDDNSVSRRMGKLQTGSPEVLRLLFLELGEREQEKQFHKQFSEYRLHGEWFDCKDALHTYISGRRLCAHPHCPFPYPHPPTGEGCKEYEEQNGTQEATA